jgi:arylsulfatase A-like enzyme/tetratricopeptide (TPR) repeat protein
MGRVREVLHGRMPRPRKRAALFVLLVLGAFAARCRHREVFPKAPVVVISIDTLRADRLPAYGYSKIETPAIDALAADAVLFEAAYSHVPLTLPSHATLLTGLLPPQNGVRDNTGYSLAADHATLPQVLSGAGYASGASVSAVVMARTSGVGRGFDYYEDSVEAMSPGVPLGAIQRSGFETERLAEEWISEQGTRPFFFLLHLYEPHSPYTPPEPWASRYAGRPYDGEVATSDAIVGKFLAFLKTKGLYDGAVIVFLSDHGEGLGDHGEDEHGLLLYREDVHVPLIVKLPGRARAGTRVARPVGLVDVFPTVAALTGVAAPKGLPGVSLLDAPAAGAPERAVYSETLFPRYHFGWSDLAALSGQRYRYIHAPRPEIYDILSDPGERRDLSAGLPPAFREMRARMLAFDRPRQAPGASDPEQVKKLAALGYIGTAAPSETATNLPDPKDHLGEIQALKAALLLHRDRRYEEAIAALEDLVRKNPAMADAWGQLAETNQKLGRSAAVLAALEKQDRLTPGSPGILLMFAHQYLEIGDLEKARLYAERALAANAPPEAHEILARVALASRDYDTAEAQARLALEGHLGRKVPLIVLAQVQRARGDLPGALGTLDEVQSRLARSGQGEMSNVHALRADLLARLGKTDEAEQEFRKELSMFPENVTAWSGLVMLYASEGKIPEARETLRSFLRAVPTPRGYLAAAQTLRILGDAAGAQQLERRAQAALRSPA